MLTAIITIMLSVSTPVNTAQPRQPMLAPKTQVYDLTKTNKKGRK